jgi:hypothetical protein
LEGLYRFLKNNKVTFEAMHAPRAEQTRLRCQAHDQVLVLHDTTIVSFNGERKGLGRIYQSGGIRGFFVHASLVVTTGRAPLGVLRAETWTRASAPRNCGGSAGRAGGTAGEKANARDGLRPVSPFTHRSVRTHLATRYFELHQDGPPTPRAPRNNGFRGRKRDFRARAAKPP